jgi:hypothetical protein
MRDADRPFSAQKGSSAPDPRPLARQLADDIREILDVSAPRFEWTGEQLVKRGWTRAVRPTPRAALTVERLAELLREMPIDFRSDDGVWLREAAWLLPRLGAASPAAAPPQEEPQ